MTPPLLSVRDLSVAFRTRGGMVGVLHRVGFDVAPGEVLGLVGESGSGKTVTAHAVLGLLDRAARVTGGAVVFEGQDLLRLPPDRLEALRGRGIAAVFQDRGAALNPIRTVGQQLADVIARHDPAPPAAIRAKAMETLRRMRIPDPERRMRALPHQLSGGMCSRIGIALALAASPRLLLADESTTGLDVITQAVVMEALRDAVRARGAGAVIITHDLALASEYCDRIAVMAAGRVVEAAPVADLFAAPRHPCTARLLASIPALASGLEDARPRPVTGGTPVLALRGLSKRFPIPRGRAGLRGLWRRLPDAALHAVDGVDLSVAPGEALGLVGESGCGKSTLARLAARLLDPDGGEVLWDGEPVQAIPAGRLARDPRRRTVQMVFQDPAGSLNPRFRLFDSIADPAGQLLPPEGAAARRARVERAAARVGLPADLLQRFPHQLSGGQKARAGLARAMVVEPRLLVLDEPTAALDAPVQAVVMAQLARLRREEGVALLLVAHDLEMVRLLCDRVAVMYLGQVVEAGPVARVFAAPRHPYTRALLSAAPRPPGRSRVARERLEGEPASPVDPDPRACRLSGRCPREEPLCRTRPPALEEVAPGHLARCHFPVFG